MSRPPTPGKYTVAGCRGCENTFRNYKSNPRTYCSAACKSAHVRSGQPCATCGKSITVPRSHGRKFCSRACWATSLRLQMGRGLRNEVAATYRRHAEERGLVWQLEDADVDRLFAGDCHWCGAPPSNRRRRERAYGDFVYSGIDRVDNDKPYTPDNCVSCCFDCNFMKRDSSAYDFVQRAKRIALKWSPSQ